jgi:hypothetical protein
VLTHHSSSPSDSGSPPVAMFTLASLPPRSLWEPTACSPLQPGRRHFYFEKPPCPKHSSSAACFRQYMHNPLCSSTFLLLSKFSSSSLAHWRTT